METMTYRHTVVLELRATAGHDPYNHICAFLEASIILVKIASRLS
jgi:hypothetical protein